MYTYLALGDSFTCGTSIASEQSYPAQLAARLRAKGISIDKPVIIAEDGWPTDELQQGVKDAQLEETFDLVTLLIGVNDQYDGEREGHTFGTFRAGFSALLRTAIAFADGRADHVLVISIPDWSAVPGAAGPYFAQASEEIDAYNSFIKAAAAKPGARFIDITPLTRTVADTPSLVANDGRHYAAAMYAQWIDALAPVAERILS